MASAQRKRRVQRACRFTSATLHPTASPLPQATVEAIQHKGRCVLTLVALDITPTSGAPPPPCILVEGKEAKLHVRGTLRAFLQGERAAYIAQDAGEGDAERIREQAEAEEKVAAEEERERAAAQAAAEKQAATAAAVAAAATAMPAAADAVAGGTASTTTQVR